MSRHQRKMNEIITFTLYIVQYSIVEKNYTETILKYTVFYVQNNNQFVAIKQNKIR